MTRSEVVAIARSWVGTPYQHQASVKGLGADCIGLLRGVAKEAGLLSTEQLAEIPLDYSQNPHSAVLRKYLNRHMLKISPDEIKPGDVLVMRFEVEEQHLALVTDKGIIHSVRSRKGVHEHRLDSRFRAFITASYRFPTIEEDPV